MTTPESMGAGPYEAHPGYSQPAPAHGYPGSTAPLQPQLPKKPMGLALAALIVGIGAFLFGLVPVFGAIVGIAAIVLGFLALSKKQSKGMAIAGIALGGVALLSSIAMTIGIGAAVNNASANKPIAVATQSAAPKTEEAAKPKPTATPEAKPVPTAEPVEETTPPVAPAPAISPEFKSALTKAENYSNLMHMSKAGLYEQLTSEYGERFSPEAAQYAVDNVQADWNANALAKAKSYQDNMAMSPAAIYDQLISEYGEQFTVEQADYAILHLND